MERKTFHAAEIKRLKEKQKGERANDAVTRGKKEIKRKEKTLHDLVL